MDKVVETKGVKAIFRDDGITRIYYNEPNYDIEDSKRIFDFVREHSPWERSPILVSSADFTSMDKEANEFNSSPEVIKHCSALAFLTKSLGHKLLATFFVRFFKPPVKTKFFAKKEEAIQWLHKYETVLKT